MPDMLNVWPWVCELMTVITQMAQALKVSKAVVSHKKAAKLKARNTADQIPIGQAVENKWLIPIK
jgi:hypothetical protein